MCEALRNTLCLILSAALTTASAAATLTIPAGTIVYGELEEEISSKKSTSEGDKVRAKVWRDVYINNVVAIKAGTPILLRVSDVQHARVAGKKGELELRAVSVRAVDGSEVPLDGGYDKSGKSRVGLSVALFALVAWPLIFIKGKQAKLEPGTIFDAEVQADRTINVEEITPVKINLASDRAFKVEVLYDEIDAKSKQKILPIRATYCNGNLEKLMVASVNGTDISPSIEVKLGNVESSGDCNTRRAEIDLEKLSKHFRKGINRFELASESQRVEIVLDVEL